MCCQQRRVGVHPDQRVLVELDRGRVRRPALYYALNGTDHRSHHEQDQAIARYVRWRNARARPKRGFAINSKIRSPDWQANYHAKVPC